LLDGLSPAVSENLQTGPVVFGVRRVDCCKSFGNNFCDTQDIPRVELDVRVTFRVNVTLGPVETGRAVQQVDILCCLQITDCSLPDTGIVRSSLQDR
jgi:hypothetical protein